MSALPTSPQPSPEAPRLVPAPEPPPRGKGPIYFFLLILVAGAIWYFRPKQDKQTHQVVVPTVRVSRGSIEATRRIAGSITANRFANITVPVMQAPDFGRGMTLTYLAPSGSMVKEGDLLMEIDAQDMRDHLDDVEANLIQADLDMKKKKSVQVAQMEAMQQRLRAARADMLKWREEIKSLPVRSAISQEQIKLALEEYTAAYEEVAREIPLTEERLRADMEVSKLAYEQQVRHRDRHRAVVAHCRVKSPIDGMVVLQTATRNGDMTQIQTGERVQSGQPVMRVVDPNSMQLEATMNQTEAELIRLKQRATLRFDAFPDIVLTGEVDAVGAMALGSRRANNYIRRIPVRVAIRSKNQRVIPDLSASADIVTAAAEGLVIPREAVTESSGKALVYVRQDGQFAAREVEIAGENNTHIVIANGLREGDEVATNPQSVIVP